MEASVHRTSSEPSLGVVGDDEESAYHSPSVLAIISLILGIAAPLCFMAPLLFAIPLAGAAVALLAIRQIAASEGVLIGRKAAVIALGLCVASICASVTRSTLTQHLLSQQARQAAIVWFELLQAGDAEQAFDRSVARRQPPPREFDTPDANAEAPPTPLELFRGESVVHFLLEHSQDAHVRYSQDLSYVPGVRGETQIEQQFAVDGMELPDGRSTATVNVTMQRVSSADAWRWLVAASKSEDIPAVTSHDGHAHPHVH